MKRCMYIWQSGSFCCLCSALVRKIKIPNLQRPGSLLQLVKQAGLRHMNSEELLSPRVLKMIARETGVFALMLQGANNISREDFNAGTTFISLMRKNLASLLTGLQCR